MRPTLFICSLTISAASVIAAPASSALPMDAVQGRPVVNGVYLNGRGPFRFLLDTAAQTNQVTASLARELSLTATFRVELPLPPVLNWFRARKSRKSASVRPKPPIRNSC